VNSIPVSGQIGRPIFQAMTFVGLLAMWGMGFPSLSWSQPHTKSPAAEAEERSIIAKPGDTLGTMLGRSGVDRAVQREAVLAIVAEFDPTELRPGDILTVRSPWNDKSAVKRISLTTRLGVRLDVVFSKGAQTILVEPELSSIEHVAKAKIENSLSETLNRIDAPERFAVELAAFFSNLYDFRRDLRSGNEIAIIWSESIDEKGIAVGEPKLSYARLATKQSVLELLILDEDSTAALYRDGDLVQRIRAPVEGARLSSVFGRRKHPVYGSVRLHTGVDYEAPAGTPISSTAAGRISFLGRLRGYGRVIDIDHGNGVTTRYAHLSSFAKGLSKQAWVQADQVIGTVGASGTATGPNLHYEVRLDGRPIDPLAALVRAQPIASANNPREVKHLTASRIIVGPANGA
jgi:murein DD-endopeptidase MepM/ murein hydrolase activator NlpD